MNTDCLNGSTVVCAICLESVNAEGRCYSYSCMHQFCYACLTKWTEIKSECPMCKAHIQTILFNIRPNGRYDEYTPLAPPPAATSDSESDYDDEDDTHEDDDGNDGDDDYDLDLVVNESSDTFVDMENSPISISSSGSNSEAEMESDDSAVLIDFNDFISPSHINMISRTPSSSSDFTTAHNASSPSFASSSSDNDWDW